MRARILASCLGLWAACYSPDKPACGFRCAQSGECPDDYVCAADGWCHLSGSPDSTVCVVDAAPDTPQPIDAPPIDADTAAPTVFAITPADGATDVPTSETVRVEFDEPVYGVSATSFLVSANATNLPGTVTSIDPYNYLFTPTSLLPPATTITVTLTSDIVDGSANPLATFTSAFTTGT